MSKGILFDKKNFSVISDELAFKILYVVDFKKTLTMRELSRELGLEYTLTRQVGKLVEKHYLNRFSPENSRNVKVSITSKGKELLQLYLTHYKNIENFLSKKD